MFTVICDGCKELLSNESPDYLDPRRYSSLNESSFNTLVGSSKKKKGRCIVEYFRYRDFDRILVYGRCLSKYIDPRITDIINKFEILDCVGVLIMKGEIICLL